MRWLIGSLATLAAAAVLGATSVAQDNPADPFFSSKYERAEFERTYRLYVQQRDRLPNGNPGVHGFRFNRADNPWLPPLDTPIQQFTSPFGWTWRPDPAHNAWLATSPEPLTLNQELSFTHPVTRAITPGEVERIIAENANGVDLYYFTAQQVVPKAKRGELRLVYTLPQQDVTGFFTSPSSACGLVRQFNTGLRISAENNLGKILQLSTGDTVQGAVNPKTYTFKFVGPTEVYEGGIKGLHLWASYGYTRTFGGGPCATGYLAHLALSKPATIAPACNRPQIVAPRTVVYRAGRVRIRVAARCAGQYVAGLRLRTRLLFGNRVRRTGSFATKAQPAPVTIGPLKREEQNPPRPKERVYFEFRSPAQMGLGPAVTRVEVLFPGR